MLQMLADIVDLLMVLTSRQFIKSCYCMKYCNAQHHCSLGCTALHGLSAGNRPCVMKGW